MAFGEVAGIEAKIDRDRAKAPRMLAPLRDLVVTIAEATVLMHTCATRADAVDDLRVARGACRRPCRVA